MHTVTLDPSVGREELERLIRSRGAVLDMAFAQSLYLPLLGSQPRDGVDVTRDLAYGSDPRHRLDLYGPSGSRPKAFIVFLPGGGFVRGDKSERANVGYHFARQGFAVALANYRLAPQHRWPAGADDVVALHQWALGESASLGRGTPIFLVGESAGAAHVAAASFIRRLQPSAGLNVAGTVLISGVYNPVLERLARRQFGIATPDPRNEPYFGADFEAYPAMSTLELIDTVPRSPLLITYAELDLLQMQVQAGELFARLVTRHGCHPQLKVIRGHNHLTQGFSVNTGDEALSATLREFFETSLAEPT